MDGDVIFLLLTLGVVGAILAGALLVFYGALRLTNEKPSGHLMFWPGGLIFWIGVTALCWIGRNLPLGLSVVIGGIATVLMLGGLYHYLYNQKRKDQP